jgi:dihydroorotate dehydrogenase
LGYVFNAVGLSGPGIQSLIERGFWECIERPFFVSLAAVKETTIEQLGEIKRMVEILRPNIIFYDRRLGVQLNISCPNVEEKDPSEGDIKDLTGRTLGMLEIVHSLGLPVDLKINVSMPIEVIKAVEHSGLCDMITLSNTIKYGTKNTQIDWRAVEPSPLAHLGGGGLSGSIILSSVLKRIAQLRNEGVKMFIKGSGGVMSASDVDLMREAGADAIEIASVLMLRPWRVAGIVQRSKIVFAK